MQVRHAVAYDGYSLWIDGRRTAVRAGEFHYWRLPSPDLWRHAFEKMKASGYNAVAIDFYWGYHSPRPGAYDFTGVRDIDRLLDAAAQEKLYVIAQPGPYIGAGAEAGGLPDWIFARKAGAETPTSEYIRESHQWLSKIDAILRRHQLTNGSGSVVLYDVNDGSGIGLKSALERQARADGITVPFASQPYAEVYGGIHWGWTGDPLHADLSGAAVPLTLPAITGWRFHEDDDETQRAFDDQAWPPLLTGLPTDADDSRSVSTKQAGFLSVDDYGFHHGAVWYRGHFTATGSERAFSLSGMTGRDGACAVWLNGSYLGSAEADDNGAIAAALPIAPTLLRRRMRNVIAVLFENMGHDEPFDRIERAQPRGMLSAKLEGATDGIRWQLLGNGEYNTDPVRGPLNAGGLAGEIAGWQLPGFADASWPTTTLPATVRRAGVTWYRAHVVLNVSLPPDTSIAVRLDDVPHSHERALIYVNGWLMGHALSERSASHVFPVPTGILRTDGDNTIAIAAWSLDGRSGLGPVSLTAVPSFIDPHVALPDVPEVRAVHGVAQLRLDVVAEGKGGRPHFVYNGADEAPTIRVRPGDTIDIALHNDLPHVSYMANAVNLHFHGLDVAPTQPGDEVLMTLARPGQTLHYTVHILPTQEPGMYWYHPHAHGETYWQVTSGMSGVIIIEGLRDRVPMLRAMRERVIVVRDVQDIPNIMTIPWYARKGTLGVPTSNARSSVGSAYPADADDNLGANQPCLPEVGLHTTVNGLVEPAIEIEQGEQQLFRILNASASRVLDLAIDNERIGLVAIDGYPISSYPGNASIVWANHIVVPPASRAEFIATGQPGPTILRSRCYDSGVGGDRDPAVVLALLRSGDATRENPLPPQPHSIASTVHNAPIAPLPAAVRRTIRLTEDANGFYINGKAFTMGAPPAVTAHVGTLEEWTILNQTDEVHDFHIHQVHFLVESINGQAALPQVWRDTVLVPVQSHHHGRLVPGVAKILVDFRNPAIRGTFVFHCHMLDHEDGGMMSTIKVI